MIRFDPDIENIEDTCQYFQNRSMQLLHDGWITSSKIGVYNVDGEDVASVCEIVNENNTKCYSLYILKQHRRKGYYKKWTEQNPDKNILTIGECNIYPIINKFKNQIYYVQGFMHSWAYREISKFYGNKMAQRAPVFYMQHIDQGLTILEKLKVSKDVKDAFCLHPIFQLNHIIKNSYDSLYSLSKKAILYVMEYRNIANSFLSTMEEHPGFLDYKKIKLSPISEVNQMLVADKIQNYYNFKKHYKEKHPRSDMLENYFQQWFKALEKYGCDLSLLSYIDVDNFTIVRA